MKIERDGDKMLVTGEFCVVDQPTRTGRIYPAEVMRKAVMKYREQIDKGAAFGVLEDGEGSVDSYPTRIRFQDVSHRIVDAYVPEGGNLIMTAEVLSTPKGGNLAILLGGFEEHGILESVKGYIRGYGSVKDGVVEDFELVATSIGVEDPVQPVQIPQRLVTAVEYTVSGRVEVEEPIRPAGTPEGRIELIGQRGDSFVDAGMLEPVYASPADEDGASENNDE